MNELSNPTATDDSFTWRRPIFRRAVIYLAVLFAVIGVLSLILLSPFLLRQLGQIKGIDWTKLSNIGQTYGAAAAILSTIALVGVTLSLLIQTQQARTERIRITRERHMELLHIILDTPEVYGPVIGAESARSGIDSRQFLFCTMWVNYARLGFQMGVLTERLLHD